MEAVQQPLITEEQIVTPIEQVLEQITPGKEALTVESIPKTITKSLDELFPEQQHDEKNLKRAKEILGKLVDKFSDAELRDVVAETQYLAETWLDDFEKSIFKGFTLKELLHEKGGT